MQNCFITRFSVFHVIKNLYIATKHKHILRNRKVYFLCYGAWIKVGVAQITALVMVELLQNMF